MDPWTQWTCEAGTARRSARRIGVACLLVVCAIGVPRLGRRGGGGIMAVPPAAERATPAPRSVPAFVSVLAALPGDMPEEQRANLECTLAPYEVLLSYLPLQALQNTTFDGRELVLNFQFGDRSYKEIELPAARQPALEPRQGGDPLLAEQHLWSESKARTLRVRRSLRLQIDDSGLCGVRAGDLEVRWGLFAFDLKLHTEHEAGRIAHDERGRILLSTDAAGQALRSEGRYVPLQADRWLVLEARGRRIEIPLREPTPLVSTESGTVPPDSVRGSGEN